MLQVEIRVKGWLDQDWSEWFDGFTIIKIKDNETVLRGAVPDQSALYGLIAKARDLGLSLIAVSLIEGTQYNKIQLSPVEPMDDKDKDRIESHRNKRT